MKRKRWDLCREFECPHPTISGKKEPNLELRHCIHHSPKAIQQRQKFTQEHTSRKPKKYIQPKTNPFFLPLVCVFQPFEVLREAHEVLRESEDDKPRVIFTSSMCAQHAPRLNSNPSQPRYPNRFNEPLCENHARYALSEHAFPGPLPSDFQPVTRRESKHLEELTALLTRLTTP